MTRFLILCLICALPVTAAPELTEADRQRLADGTSDNTGVLDQEDGFYVLLRNASTWKGGDFSGDAGAAVAPPPDYGFLKAKPEQARGNVYLIEGWLAGDDRWPTLVNHSSDKLVRAGDPSWGDQVTRWTIITEKDNPGATVIVLFNDPNAKMTAPKPGSKVRIAARFHKLWTIRSSDGTPYTYPVFIGGAAEQTEQASASTAAGGATSSLTKILAAIVIVAGFFVVMRILMKKVSTGSGGGTQLHDRLEEMRREREREASGQQGDEAEEDIDDLPEDPVAALRVLRERHHE
ncbi:MAG: hypothetical protein KTR15_03345 [Phycisphaeraceae bacterium]|nr:hypothetical protein [Phycisphaeraceae bacterium]